VGFDGRRGLLASERGGGCTLTCFWVACVLNAGTLRVRILACAAVGILSHLRSLDASGMKKVPLREEERPSDGIPRNRSPPHQQCTHVVLPTATANIRPDISPLYFIVRVSDEHMVYVTRVNRSLSHFCGGKYE